MPEDKSTKKDIFDELIDEASEKENNGNGKSKTKMILQILRYFQQWDSQLPAIVKKQEELVKSATELNEADEALDDRVTTLENEQVLHTRDFSQGCPACKVKKDLDVVQKIITTWEVYWRIVIFLSGASCIALIGILAKILFGK